MSRATDTLIPVLIEAFGRIPGDHAGSLRTELLAAAEHMPKVEPRDDAQVARLLALLAGVLTEPLSREQSSREVPRKKPWGQLWGQLDS